MVLYNFKHAVYPCSFSPLCASLTSCSGQKKQWQLLALFDLETKKNTFLVPGGVREQRIPLLDIHCTIRAVGAG